MNDVVARLERWLAQRCPHKLERLAPGLTDEVIEAHERQLGATFPEGLRALYRWRDGARPGQFGVSILGRYDLSPLAQIAERQRMLNELLDHGSFPTKNWWRKTWLPIFDKGTGDLLCWDPRGSFDGSPGQVLEFWHTDHDRTVLAPSFDGFLTAYVDSLDAGLWTYDEEHGLEDDDRWKPFLAARFPGHPFRAIDFEGKRGRAPAPTPAPVEAAPGRPVKAYSAGARYEVGDRVAHPTFGTGVVQAIEQTKADIRFESGRRTLVHARTSGEKLEKPQRIDHSKPDRSKL
jgi:cell wall assembly regulator SMI1